jgi:hypothetical protein
MKKGRLEPTRKMPNYRPDICCAKNEVLIEIKNVDPICTSQFVPMFTTSHSGAYIYKLELFCKKFILEYVKTYIMSFSISV